MRGLPASLRAVPGRLGRLLLGTFVVLFAFEIILRLVGGVLWLFRPGADPAPAPRTILCEGDSFTYGIGGTGYPSQLEKLLNERAGKREFRVVNEGIPGRNTAQILERLRLHLEEHRPEVLIVLTGENDSWNFIRREVRPQTPRTESGEALGDDLPPAEASARPRGLALERVLLRSRVYKFAKIMLIGLTHATFRGGHGEEIGLDDPASAAEADILDRAQAHANRWEFGEAKRLYAEYIRDNPRDPNGYLQSGMCLLRNGEVDEAVAVLKRGVGDGVRKTASAQAELYHQLGWAYHRKGLRKDAIKAWRTGLGKHPKKEKLYVSLARAHYEEGDLWGVLEYGKAHPRVRANPMHRFLLSQARRSSERGVRLDRLVRTHRRRDVRAISALAKEHGARVIFASYPEHHFPDIQEAAEKEKASYIDFTRLFKLRFKSSKEFLSSDNCHCNTAGYRVMAETFADEIQGARAE